MQLDIFENSRDVMLRSDVVEALERRAAAAARRTWQALQAEFPADECLPALGVLVGALESRTLERCADHAAVRVSRLAIQERIEPAALRMLGGVSGADWTAWQWRELVQRASHLPFRADCADEHAAPLSLRAGDWAAAIDAAGQIESWRRIPAPLNWMAEARYRLSGLEAAWPLLAELAWLAPERFDASTRRLGDRVLQPLRRKFDAHFEGDGDAPDLAWFPAWVLTEAPALAPLLEATQASRGTAPERAMRVVLELLRLERQGRHHEIVERRKLLRGLNNSLYAAYMKTR